MDPIFTEEQLNRMSREDICSLLKIMQQHQQKQEDTLQKQESRIRLLEEQKKELEFLNAMLSDRLALAQKKRFGASSEKYAEGYTQLGLFNEAEQEADPNVPEPDLEEVHPSPYKRKKRSGKKEEDLSSFETTEVIEYKLMQIAIGNGHQGHIRRPVENIFSGQQILFHGVLDMSLHRI